MRGGVWYDAGATGEQKVFFEHVLSSYQASSGLYPYLYCRGSATNCKIEGMNYSVTPFIQGNNLWNLTGIIDSRILYNMLPGGATPSAIGALTPIQNPFRMDTMFIPFEPEIPSLKMHVDVWAMLGFGRFAFTDNPDGYRRVDKSLNDGDYPQDGWVAWQADTVRDARALSDNFVVVVDDLRLDSYDSSRTQYDRYVLTSKFDAANMGRRKNILMTIPVNDNANNTVEFDTNTPIYIDLLNDQAINLRNLNLRILNKKFGSIVCTGESIMTVLIDSEKIR